MTCLLGGVCNFPTGFWSPLCSGTIELATRWHADKEKFWDSHAIWPMTSNTPNFQVSRPAFSIDMAGIAGRLYCASVCQFAVMAYQTHLDILKTVLSMMPMYMEASSAPGQTYTPISSQGPGACAGQVSQASIPRYPRHQGVVVQCWPLSSVERALRLSNSGLSLISARAHVSPSGSQQGR